MSQAGVQILADELALAERGIAAERGYDINVLAYEGAVFLPSIAQAGHPNPIHGNDVSQENHPLPREWIRIIAETAEKNGGTLDWVNCGMCADERGWLTRSRVSVAAARLRFPRDLARFQADGGTVLVSASDLSRYGLTESDLVPDITIVEDTELAGLVADHDMVSFW